MQSQIELEFQPELRPLSAQPFGLQRLVIGAIVALSAVVGEAHTLSAHAASLTHWNFDPAANQLEITVKDGTTPRYFLMAQPARIVVDLPDTAIGDVSAQKTYSGIVRQIRVSQFEPGLTRIVMEISPGVSLAPGQVKLQKVGDRVTQASNSRWVLSPLVTKSLSANAVSVQPSSMQPTRPISLIAIPPKPPTVVPSATSAPPVNSPLQQKPAVIAINLPSPPPLSPSPAERSNTALITNAADGGGGKPAGSTTAAAPTSPVALAPVLPASPIQSVQTTTPLPPTSVTLIDPNVVIDTSSGVAIAVPSPTTLPSTKVAPQAASPQVITAADIPMTLAARPSTAAPSVSVPPLSDRVQSDRVQSDRGAVPQANPSMSSRQPEAASETLPALPTVSARQPSVSVPPPIRVGTPSLSIPNTQSRIESATPYTSSDTAPPSVSVPPLQSPSPLQPTTAPSTPRPETASASYDANTIRQSPSTTPLPGVAGTSYDVNTVRQQPSNAANLALPLKLAPLRPPAVQSIATPTYNASTVRQPPTSPDLSPIVEFGQPLPATLGVAQASGQPLASVNQSPGVRQAFKPTAPNVLLPAGTPFSLLYPGNSALSLHADRPQQEVLVLQTDLHDVSGKLLAPAGSLVTGHFETTTAGSRFVTQAIALTGRSLPLVAQSAALDGTRQVTSNNLVRNSGIGTLAGGVLGAISGSTGLGAIGGAAAGAAATFITAPKPAVIQPGQLIQVRLTQDLSSPQ